MKILTKRRFYFSLLIYSLFSLVCFFAALVMGQEDVGILKILKSLFLASPDRETGIFLYQRLPRVIMAFIAGGTFAVTGYAYQAVFRNSLAGPYTTGVTSGGTLGAVMALSFPSLQLSFAFFSSVQIFSIIGSGLVILCILLITKRNKDSINSILLTGVSFGILISAFVMLVRYLLSPNILVVVDRWMMGGLSVSGFQEIAGVFTFLMPGLFMLFMQIAKMNYLVSGREAALSRGINPDTVHLYLLLGGTLATASVVSVVGPIAFVGLMVPHIIKMISGYDARIGMPASFLFGGAFLSVCDAVSRIIIAPSELPAGILTAFIGGIYFIYLVNRKKK